MQLLDLNPKLEAVRNQKKINKPRKTNLILESTYPQIR